MRMESFVYKINIFMMEKLYMCTIYRKNVKQEERHIFLRRKGNMYWSIRGIVKWSENMYWVSIIFLLHYSSMFIFKLYIFKRLYVRDCLWLPYIYSFIRMYMNDMSDVYCEFENMKIESNERRFFRVTIHI